MSLDLDCTKPFVEIAQVLLKAFESMDSSNSDEYNGLLEELNKKIFDDIQTAEDLLVRLHYWICVLWCLQEAGHALLAEAVYRNLEQIFKATSLLTALPETDRQYVNHLSTLYNGHLDAKLFFDMDEHKAQDEPQHVDCRVSTFKPSAQCKASMNAIKQNPPVGSTPAISQLGHNKPIEHKCHHTKTNLTDEQRLACFEGIYTALRADKLFRGNYLKTVSEYKKQHTTVRGILAAVSHHASYSARIFGFDFGARRSTKAWNSIDDFSAKHASLFTADVGAVQDSLNRFYYAYVSFGGPGNTFKQKIEKLSPLAQLVAIQYHIEKKPHSCTAKAWKFVLDRQHLEGKEFITHATHKVKMRPLAPSIGSNGSLSTLNGSTTSSYASSCGSLLKESAVGAIRFRRNQQQ